MRTFPNKKKASKLSELKKTVSLENDKCVLSERCKFNFSYFDSSQKAGQDFKDWSYEQLYKLANKLKHYTTKKLNYWQNQSTGNGLSVLEIYGKFPSKSKTSFAKPTYIPHEVLWGRFRLEQKVRLVGFTIPSKYHNETHQKTGVCYDKNTFYVVFLDKDHKFYHTEKK